MSRTLKIVLSVLLGLLGLALINAFTTSDETKSASLTAADGQILALESADVQVVDSPATNPDATGSPIVLLHCYACSLSWWDPIAPALNEEHRVIRIDLLGHGGSEKPSSGYDIEAQAAMVAQALTELEVEGATVIGHSMGGSVATSLAQTSSQLADRVVIINSSPAPDLAELPLTARLARSPILGQAIWKLRTSGLIKNGYKSAFADGFDLDTAFEDPDILVDGNRAMTFTSFKDAAEANDQFLDEGTLPDRLTEALVPVMVIFGERDQLIDPDPAVELYSAIPGVELARIAAAGHSPNIETPDDTARLINEFIPVPTAERPIRPPATQNTKKPQGKNAGANGSKDGKKTGGTGKKQSGNKSANKDGKKGN